jgi:hypothetical protein
MLQPDMSASDPERAYIDILLVFGVGNSFADGEDPAFAGASAAASRYLFPTLQDVLRGALQARPARRYPATRRSDICLWHIADISYLA